MAKRPEAKLPGALRLSKNYTLIADNRVAGEREG